MWGEDFCDFTVRGPCILVLWCTGHIPEHSAQTVGRDQTVRQFRALSIHQANEVTNEPPP